MNLEVESLIGEHKKLLKKKQRRSWKYEPLSIEQFKAKKIRKKLHEEYNLTWEEINERK